MVSDRLVPVVFYVSQVFLEAGVEGASRFANVEFGAFTLFPAMFMVLFPPAIYCVIQLSSRPFLYHVSQSRALFLPPASHIQLTQDKLN